MPCWVYHSPYRLRGACLPCLATEPSDGSVDMPQNLWRVASATQTYGYLPSRRVLPLPLGRNSFPVPLRIGGRVCLSGWVHTEKVYPRTVTNFPYSTYRVTLLPLSLHQTATNGADNKTENEQSEYGRKTEWTTNSFSLFAIGTAPHARIRTCVRFCSCMYHGKRCCILFVIIL